MANIGGPRDDGHSFFDLSSEWLCITDEAGRFVVTNEAMRGAFALEGGEPSLDLASIVHVADRGRVGEALSEKASERGFEARVELREGPLLVRFDGTAHPKGDRIAWILRPLGLVGELPSLVPPPLGQDEPAEGETCFDEMAAELARQLSVEHASIGRFMGASPAELHAIGGERGALEGTVVGAPWEAVARGQEVVSPAYVGVPLRDVSGAVVGVVHALDDQPIEASHAQFFLGVLRAFASWASVEMEQVRIEESLLTLLGEREAASGMPLLSALARRLAEALGVRYGLVAHYIDGAPGRARAVAFWTGQETIRFDYALEGTPCSIAAHGDVAIFPENLQALFPEDVDLVHLDAQSYLGVPLFGEGARPIGHLAVLDTKPMQASARRTRWMKILAARIAPEIGKLRAEGASEEVKARLRFVVEHVADAMIMHTPEGEIVDVNPACCESLGYAREELLGQTMAFVEPGFSVERLPGSENPSRSVLVERERRKKSGETFPVEARVGIVEIGGRVLCVSIARDITERRSSEERLQAALRELRTPIIQAWTGVVVLPVIGELSEERASQMTESLLEEIVKTSATHAILDLTGVRAVDSATAGLLLRIVSAASLLGSQCLLSGISPAVAQALVEQGYETKGLSVHGTLRSALEASIASQGPRARAPHRKGPRS